MLAEVFGAVFSRQGVRAVLWMALLALLFLLLSLAVTLPLLLALGFPLQAPLRGATPPVLGVGFWTALAGAVVASFLLNCYYQMSLISLARQLRSGGAARFEESLRGKWAKLPSYAGSYLLFGLIVWGPLLGVLAAALAAVLLMGGPGSQGVALPQAAPAAPGVPDIPRLQAADGLAPGGVASENLRGLFAGLAVALLFIAGHIAYSVFFMVKLTFFRFALVLDGKSAVEALKGSWRLTRRRWWPLFGTFLLLGLVLGVLAVVAAIAVALPVAVAFGGHLGALALFVAFYFAFIVLWSLFGTPALFYAGLVAYEELTRSAPEPVPVAS